ncbi:hypothetical protein GE09DRAFT_966707 [Coniochaeta sp. 2T2.1]|nr:hypothetical protein GE09DRAFT_966707 [Coniochaeta sp. 2T2.1]
MSLGRQKHQPIALADILADQDQTNSNSDSEVLSLDRIHITDMQDTRYLPAHQTEGIPRTCSAAPLTTAAYQDMTPFSTVASFNYPATADATLLTPVSNAGSPPMHQRPKEFMRQFHQTQSSSIAQQPTPPNTSTGVYYYSGHDLSSSSQSPSPMTVHPHGSDFTMTPYMRQSPSHLHGHPSPKPDDAPPPMQDAYLGSYGVSAGPCNDPEVPNSFRGYQDFNTVDPVDPSVFSRPGGPIYPANMMTTGTAHTPILAHPDPMQYRPPRAGDIENLSGPGYQHITHHGPSTYQSRAASTPGRRTNTRRGGKGNPNSRKGSAGARSQPTSRATDTASQDNDVESIVEGEDAVALSDKCEEDARFIFDARRELVMKGQKGKGMWEAISRMYEERYGQRLEKATLQMRLTRAFAKHAIWPEKEIEILKEAFQEFERKRYRLILDWMKDNGGGKCWNWTPPLIEAKLIDLGYEEPNLDEKTNTRKRRRLARRRRQAAAQHTPILHGGENWANGLGLTQAQAPMHHHHDHEDPEDMIPNYTTEQRDQYIEEVVRTIKPEDLSPEPDVMDVQYHTRNEDSSSNNNRDQSQQQNTQVAKQAVEHLMLNGMRMQ